MAPTDEALRALHCNHVIVGPRGLQGEGLEEGESYLFHDMEHSPCPPVRTRQEQPAETGCARAGSTWLAHFSTVLLPSRWL